MASALPLPAPDQGRAAGRRSDAPGFELGAHPARSQSVHRCIAGKRQHIWGELLYFGDVPGIEVAPRVRTVETIDIAQQYQQLRAGELRDASRQAIIVTDAELGGGGAVILVDDRHRPGFQKRIDRGTGVEEGAALFGVVGGEQQLRRHEPGRAESFAPSLHEQGLAGSGGSLLRIEPARARQAERAAAERYGAGADQDDLLPLAAQGSDISGEARHPGRAGSLLPRHQRRAELHHQPPCERHRHQSAEPGAGKAR
jgi:hypothetical protein